MATRQQRMLHSVEQYNVRAVRQLHGARRGFAVSGARDGSETYTYVYCIKLPSFQCYTIPKMNPLQQASFPPLSQPQQTALIKYLPCGDLEVLQKFEDARSYTMVKVGISTNPARRLCEIMRGLAEFGARDTEFMISAIRESDSPDNTIENGKWENKIVFIKKCCDIGDAESQIRNLIGIKLGQSFRDKFTAHLHDDQRSALDQVGMTEWVLIKTDLMKAIQKEYMENWPSVSSVYYRRRLGMLFGLWNPTGQEFYRKLHYFCLHFLQESGTINGIPRAILADNTGIDDVRIKFSPNFTFTLHVPVVIPPTYQPGADDEHDIS